MNACGLLTGLHGIAPLIVLTASSVTASFVPYTSTVIRGGDQPQVISIDVSGVKDLYLVATTGPDDYSHDQAIWASPTLTDSQGITTDMTALPPRSHQVGWGRLFINENHTGKALRIADQSYAKGFWAHGPSVMYFPLNGRYSRFDAKVGIDAGATPNGSVVFQVLDRPPKMPAESKLTKRSRALIAAPSANAPHQFNPEAAQLLLDEGVEKLLFVRRFTLSANHVYTEYVNSRWTPGGGLAVLDLKTEKATDLIPELSEGVVNRFDISYDGKRVVFDYKHGQHEGYRIYEANLDPDDPIGPGEARMRPLTFPTADEALLSQKYGSSGYHHGTDDLHPCYLPDGGIVFVTTRCQYGILCDSSDNYTTKNLYRMDGNGKQMRPLSHSPVSEATPTVLPDGRILYHRWEYVDKAAGNLKCLWAMQADGTGSAEVYGNNISFPETMIYPRPIPNAPGKIVMLGSSHCCPNNAMGAVIVIDRADDVRAEESMKFVTPDIRALAHTGFHFEGRDGEWVMDKTGSKGRLFKDPYPLSEDLFITACKPKGYNWDDPRAYALVLINGSGEETPLYADEQISCWHPYPIMAREKPPVTGAVTNPKLAEQGLALCVVNDVYVGMEDVPRGSVKYLRILETVPRPWAMRKSWYKDDRDGMAHSALGEGHLGLKVQHGVVPVEDDGSAQFYVPSERNIFFQALDKDLLMLQTERTYVHYMPGETRSCIGCHETPQNTPTHARSYSLTALKRAPSTPAPQPDEAHAQKLFNYEHQIQPIWDAHCTECHCTENPQGNLNLSGTAQGVYSISYNNLVKLGKTEKQTLGNRTLRDEDVGSASIQYLPPNSLGARTSPLAALISNGNIKMTQLATQAEAKRLLASHAMVKLSPKEQLQITNWLDVNCPFHPSYWGRLNEKFKTHPNYRPPVSFAEALERKQPESIRLREAAAH
jgi:hypothetical protein